MQKLKKLSFVLICLTLLCLCACNKVEKPPAHQHVFGYWETVTPATCTAEGSQQRLCSCGEKETRTLEKLAHNLTKTDVEPTCEKQGYSEYVCDCGYTFKNQNVAPLGHTLTKAVTAPTCVAEGYTTYTCKCGYSFVTERTAPLGHTLTKSVTAPTCTTEGYTTHTCECGYTFVAERTAPLGHTLEKSVTAPTCTTEGYTTYTCKCGYSFAADRTVPLGHTLVKTVTEPTCTAEGYTTYACKCGYSFKANIVAPKDHKLSKTVTAPTCTQRGHTFFECDDCDYEIYGDYVTPLAHKNSKITRVYPTVRQSGYTLYECQDCEHTYKEDYLKYTDIVKVAYTENTVVLKKGIDTSQWNHQTGATSDDLLPIDWAALKALGVDFVILRAGSSKGIDPAFEADYLAAKEAGLEVGAYFYTYSLSISEIEDDAQMLLEWLGEKQFEYPIYLDIEDPSLEALGKELLTDMCFAFADVIQTAGYYCGMYLNGNWLTNILDTDRIVSSFDVWYARYQDNEEMAWEDTREWLESYGEQLGMWQYTDKGVLDGIYGNFDLNYAYKDYTQIIIEHGLNGF